MEKRAGFEIVYAQIGFSCGGSNVMTLGRSNARIIGVMEASRVKIGTYGPFQVCSGFVNNNQSDTTVMFPFTFSNTPNVICTMVSGNGAGVFCISVNSVSTTGFTAIKRLTFGVV